MTTPDAPAPAEAAAGGVRARSWRSSPIWHLLWIAPLLLVIGVTAARAFSGDEAPQAPIIEQFVVLPGIADPGGEVTLKWSVQRAESVEIAPAPGNVDPVGEITLTAGDAPVTYILTATNGTERRSATTQLQIAPQAPSIGYFEAEPAAISAGESIVLNWSVVGANTAVTIDPGDGSMLAPIGSVILQPDATTTYTLTATNPAGTAVQAVQVVVGPPPARGPPEIASFTVSPERLDPATQDEPPETLTLSWQATGADSVELVGAAVQSGLPAEGSLEIPVPTETSTYYLIATGGGGSTTRDVTFDVAKAVPATVPTPAMVFIPAPFDEDVRGAAGSRLDGSRSGNTNEGVAAQSSTTFSDPLPSVDLFSASPNPARAGDEVIVRWAISRAESVSVQTVPAPEGTTPLVAKAGVYRFIARQNVAVLLEATSAGGSTVRRQVGVRVVQPSEPVIAEVGGSGMPLLAAGGVVGGSVVVNDRGESWLYEAETGQWVFTGSLGPGVSAVAVAGTALFGIGEDGAVRALDLTKRPPLPNTASAAAAASPVASPAASPLASPAGISGTPASPGVAGTPATPAARGTPVAAGTPVALADSIPVNLGSACKQAVALAGHERATGAGDQVAATLLVACAEPQPIVVALPVNGVAAGSPRWTARLETVPVSMTLGAVDGAVAAVAYPLYSPRAAQIDLLDVASGKAAEVTVTGQVVAAVPSPDGRLIVVALFEDPALHLIDRRGVAPKRLALPGEVRTIAWASSAVARAAPAASAAPQPTAFVGGTDAFGEASPVVPTPTPIPADPRAVDGAGAVLVTWLDQPGGALVSLATWSPETMVAAVISPSRPLRAAVDDGRTIVVAGFGPNRGIAFPWRESGRSP